MRRALLFVLLCALPAAAQFTTVSGTITDPNGLPYANGTISATLVSSASPVFTATNLPYTPPAAPVGLNSAGAFVMQLADVTTLAPGGSTYNFSVCSGPNATVFPSFGKGPVCFTVTGVTISGASQSLTATLSGSAVALTVPFGAGAGCGSGTTNTFMIFTGATTCGNSPMTYNGSTLITSSKRFSIGVGGAAFDVTGVLANYNGLTSVGNSLAQIVGIAQGSTFTGNMTATTLLASVPASGHQNFRCSCYLVVSTAAATSSNLPQCQISWTDANTSVVETTTFSGLNGGNTVGTFNQGTIFINPKPGTAITVSTTGYASNPGAAMIYVDDFWLEAL